MTVGSHVALAAALLGLTAGAAVAADSPVGVWIDHTGRGAVEITECGKGKLCGRLVWLKDEKNAKACGTEIIGEAGPVASGTWDGGWIYSPENDSKYDVELKPQSNGTLTVLGYAGTKLFSEEMTWTRAPADLKRCDLQEAKALPKASDTAAVVAAPAAAAAGAATAKPTEGPSVATNQPPAAAQPNDAAPATDAPTRTAQADAEPPAAAKPSRKVAKRNKTRMCRVDAPFVRVEFPCDDDD